MEKSGEVSDFLGSLLRAERDHALHLEKGWVRRKVFWKETDLRAW